jgi:ATP-dependent Clp protease, protease subunit
MTAPDISGQFNGGRPQAYIPTIEETTAHGRIVTDPFSRLAKEQQIYLFEEVNNQTSAVIVAQLFHYLNNGDKAKGIDFYIQSPGGSINDGEAIMDAMERLKDEGWVIRTFAVGHSQSMGSLLLVAGTKGHRTCLPNANIMIHEPASGRGQAKAEDQIHDVAEIAHMKTRMAVRYATYTNMSYDQAMKIMTGPDYNIRAEEALALGVVDKIDYPENNKEIAAATKWLNEQHYLMHQEAQVQPGLLPNAPDFKKPAAVVVPAPVNQP